jgi:hypothetical protein
MRENIKMAKSNPEGDRIANKNSMIEKSKLKNPQ